ncbi:MAG: hypothetical protein WD114_06470 [Phycisphaerales bacterium]
MDPIVTIMMILAAVLAGSIALAAVIYLFGKLFGLTFLVLGNIFRFIGQEIADLLRFVGSILAGVVFAPLVVLSILIGRWSASRHYAGALMSELRSAGRCVYRFFVGNPARMLGLSGALEGVEQRVPYAMAAAPTRDKPARSVGMFDGYRILGSLKGGGSGGKLYIAEPDELKRAVFAKRRLGDIQQVVIKVFSLSDGSSLPQIVRESRALDAARSLGLVLEHEMAPDRFFYVMRYVPGESLSVVTQRMHAMSGPEGLDNEHLASVMGYTRDLLVALDTYHNAELWHKDVKPDNIIIDGRGDDAKAHLVDFGLITPMRSAMTLTTHGTEYFRDPELVRQALRGVKVHQIDGSKFDVYAAGAVLYSVIENSFPAHSGLSQLTRRCPEALRWIVRRAMAEYDRRYPSAAAMLADLQVVLSARDPFKDKPIDLPSVSEGDLAAAERIESEPVPDFGGGVEPSFARRAGTPVPPREPAPVPRALRVARPKANIVSWWSGGYTVEGAHNQDRRGPAPRPARIARPLRDASDRRPAAEQVKEARRRAHNRRTSAAARINSARGRRKGNYSNTPGAAVVFAGLLGMAVLFGGVVVGSSLYQDMNTPAAPTPPDAPRIAQHTPIASLPAIDARVLLVPMLPQPIEAGVMQDLERGLAGLRESGIEIVGDASPGEQDAESIELTAALRNTLGSVPMDAPQLPAIIKEWLGSAGVDGVLLITTVPGQPDQRRALLVTDRFHTDIPLSDRTAPDLLRVLAGNGYAAN